MNETHTILEISSVFVHYLLLKVPEQCKPNSILIHATPPFPDEVPWQDLL